MLQNINKRHAELRKNDPQLEARIQAYELAFRMQMQAPEAFEVDKESDATKSYTAWMIRSLRIRLAVYSRPPTG